MKKGFTLVEVLIMMLIILVLATIAVPTYEKVIEKARLNEVRTTLKRIYDSKMRIMENMEKTTYDQSFGFENLDFQFKCESAYSNNGHVIACNTEDFTYWMCPPILAPTSTTVCASRRKGDGTDVKFTYGEQNGGSGGFVCWDNSGQQKCSKIYGLADNISGWPMCMNY